MQACELHHGFSHHTSIELLSTTSIKNKTKQKNVNKERSPGKTVSLLQGFSLIAHIVSCYGPFHWRSESVWQSCKETSKHIVFFFGSNLLSFVVAWSFDVATRATVSFTQMWFMNSQLQAIPILHLFVRKVESKIRSSLVLHRFSPLPTW